VARGRRHGAAGGRRSGGCAPKLHATANQPGGWPRHAEGTLIIGAPGYHPPRPATCNGAAQPARGPEPRAGGHEVRSPVRQRLRVAVKSDEGSQRAGRRRATDRIDGARRRPPSVSVKATLVALGVVLAGLLWVVAVASQRAGPGLAGEARGPRAG